VLLRLTSHDVIHSFWVPNLQGKRDLIPGHETSLWLQADHPGVFRGQCAEFCGHQHAHMAFLVIAEPPDQFAAWLEQQRRPAVPPTDAASKRGQEVFLSGACVLCHAIQGTAALADVAPDLTHVAGRRTIAAGTLPNSRGHLAGWIVDPQQIKPGNKMPPNNLGGQDLQALLAYLGSLR
jgi:cytochrome c oxidase subunit II